MDRDELEDILTVIFEQELGLDILNVDTQDAMYQIIDLIMADDLDEVDDDY